MKKLLLATALCFVSSSVFAADLELSVSNDIHRVDRKVQITARVTEDGMPIKGDIVEMAIAFDGNAIAKKITKPTNGSGHGNVFIVPREVGFVSVCAVSATGAVDEITKRAIAALGNK